MGSVFHIMKIILAVGFGVAGAVCCFVAFPLALTLFGGSVAFSLMPE